jgi:DNA-binding NarL/FixJ family response regulator
MTTSTSGSELASLLPPPVASARDAVPSNDEWLSRTRAIQLDELSNQAGALRSVWDALASGHWTAGDTFSTETRLYLVLKRCSVRVRPPSATDLEMLRRTLLGARQKVVAMDSHKSHSSVTGRLGSCMSAMGFDPHASRAPALLVAAAAAAAGQTRLSNARTTQIEQGGTHYWIVSVPRLEDAVAHSVTPTELKIVKLVVEGMTHQRMAQEHGSSPRTVANHISSVFHRIGVSGRSELLVYLVQNFQPVPRPTPARDSGQSVWSAYG